MGGQKRRTVFAIFKIGIAVVEFDATVGIVLVFDDVVFGEDESGMRAATLATLEVYRC